MKISITNDSAEMIRMAKEIAAEKSAYYSVQTLGRIRDQVRLRLPDRSEAEIGDALYRTIYFYWAYGCDVDEYFYYHFAEKDHDEIKKYVTKREKVIYTNLLNRIDDAHFLQNKYETYQLFRDAYKRDMILCDGEDCEDAFLRFVKKHPVFVVKALHLGGGQGIHKDDVIGLTEEEIREKFRSLLTEVSIINGQLNSWGSKSGFAVEELILQGEEIGRLHPQSVNVVRMPTLLIDGEIRVYQPWLKIGCGDSFVDNGHTGGLMAGIDVKTGVVDTPGYSELPAMYEYHPDTELRIPGTRIPAWEELVDTVKALSSRLPSIRYISWDMAWTDKGWAVMEGNFRGAFMWQFFRQKGMKAEFEDMTGLRLNKEFWWE